jgi:hypothetical protein
MMLASANSAARMTSFGKQRTAAADSAPKLDTVKSHSARRRPSARDELEITDVNNAYIARGDLTFDVLLGWWTDAGTFESLARANERLGG